MLFMSLSNFFGNFWLLICFIIQSRTPDTITIDVNGRTEEYELLCILDFNNVRKRMSVSKVFKVQLIIN